MSTVTASQRSWAYLPLFAQLPLFLADPRSRAAMHYRIDDSKRAPAREYWDIFDGEEYRSKLHLFDGKRYNNIVLSYMILLLFKDLTTFRLRFMQTTFI